MSLSKSKLKILEDINRWADYYLGTSLVDAYVLNNAWYGLVRSSSARSYNVSYGSRDKYIIKKISLSDFTSVSDDGEWLTHPEESYETESGARYAILLNATDVVHGGGGHE